MIVGKGLSVKGDESIEGGEMWKGGGVVQLAELRIDVEPRKSMIGEMR